jgi:hypothetical protein
MEKRKCAFKKCEKYFALKNPKKRFCGLSCKNKAAYQFELETYPWEVKLNKARRKNIQILEYLYKQNKVLVRYRELQLLGFDRSCTIIPPINELGQAVYRYGNNTLTELFDNEYKIDKI